MDEHTAGEQSSKGQYHFFFKIFFMWTIFTVFIEFVIILFNGFCVFFLAANMCDLSSLSRDRTCIPCTARQRLKSLGHQGSPQRMVS